MKAAAAWFGLPATSCARLPATLTDKVPVTPSGGVTTSVYKPGPTAVKSLATAPALSTMSLASKPVTASVNRNVSTVAPVARPPALSLIFTRGSSVSITMARVVGSLALPAGSIAFTLNKTFPSPIFTMSPWPRV